MTKIKYSDCSKGYKYGSDHKQLDNWDPDKNYGQEYVKVYFRIEAEYYKYPYTDCDQGQQEAFYQEAKQILMEEEFYPDGNYMKSKKQCLYIHPLQITGEIKKAHVRKIAESLNQGKTFRLRWVDLYQTYYDMSDIEYEAKLQKLKDKIKASILLKAQTKRKNLVIPASEIMIAVANEYRILRVGIDDGVHSRTGEEPSGQTERFVFRLIQELLQERLLVPAENKNGNFCIRTINKQEQKERKISIETFV